MKLLKSIGGARSTNGPGGAKPPKKYDVPYNQRYITTFMPKYRWLLFADWLYRRILIDKDSQ